jgi:hypothetical protein
MAKVKIQGHASGTGVLTVTAPDTDENRTITLPDETATLSTFDPDGAVTINDTGADVDFRVESDTITSALFVEGATGNIGIGTQSPNIIAGSNAHIDIRSPTYSFIELGVTGTKTSGDIGYLEFMNGNNNRMATVVGGCDGANDDGYMYFSTSNGGSFTERMRIDSNGKVLVGDTNDRNTTSTLYAFGNTSSTTGTNALELASAASPTRYLAAFINSNGHVGSISTNGSATAFNTSSDYRLKENVDYTWDATTRLKQLKPARFNFIADDTKTLDGFIAHEVSSVVPEAISGTKDAMAGETFYTEDDVETQGENPTKEVGDVKTYSSTKIDPQGIDQSKLVPLLVKTIQELEARITALEA